MKVYMVIEKIADDYVTEYDMVVENHVYLDEGDAREKLEELAKIKRWCHFEIREFEVKE